MSQRSQRDRERALDDALEGSGLADSSGAPEDAEFERLVALAGEVRALGDSLPDIDERRVWLTVRAGMLREPQRAVAAGLWGRLLPWASFTPRLVFASIAGVLLFLGAAATSLVMQPTGNASAAFLERLDSITNASIAAEGHREVSPEERARIEREAFELLDLAARPGLLSDIPPAEADVIRARLIDARGVLASVLDEDVSEARTLAALAAVSGILENTGAQARQVATTVVTTQPAAPTASPTTQATPTATATPSAAVSVPRTTATPTPTRPPQTPTATPSPAPSPTLVPTNSPTPRPTATPTATVPAVVTPSPSPTPTVVRPASSPTVAPTEPPTQKPSPAEASARSAALAKAQSRCSKVVDRASLTACFEAGAAAQEACPVSDPTCLAVLEGIVKMAEERLERMREGCRRLSGSRARAACEEATRLDLKRSPFAIDSDGTPDDDAPQSPTASGGGRSGRPD